MSSKEKRAAPPAEWTKQIRDRIELVLDGAGPDKEIGAALGGLPPRMAKAYVTLRTRMLGALAEIDRLQQRVNDLQSRMYVNCVYCGHRYGPDPGTPVAMAEVLKQHIEQCPKHPLAEALQKIRRLEWMVYEASRQIAKLETRWVPGPDAARVPGEIYSMLAEMAEEACGK